MDLFSNVAKKFRCKHICQKRPIYTKKELQLRCTDFVDLFSKLEKMFRCNIDVERDIDIQKQTYINGKDL